MKRQRSGEPVMVGRWALSEDFPYFPVGSKPKRMLICPQNATEDFLIPGHAYLFKQALDWQEYQVWSEVIAYRIGAVIGLDVPPCFIAVDEESGEVGALVEFFYGFPDERPIPRLIHGADFLPLKDRRRGRPHHLLHNLRLCKALGVKKPEAWWSRTLLFDALVGNTDRHPENWGFLIQQFIREEALEDQFEAVLKSFDVRLAPVFDNATSLGYELRNPKIPDMLESGALARYIARGTHHAGWAPGHEAIRGMLSFAADFAKCSREWLAKCLICWISTQAGSMRLLKSAGNFERRFGSVRNALN